jgi:hypothetical protein
MGASFGQNISNFFNHYKGFSLQQWAVANSPYSKGIDEATGSNCMTGSANRSGFVPGSGNRFDEFKRRLSFVGSRTVGHHLNRSLVNHVHGQLMCAGAHHYGMLHAWNEFVSCDVVKPVRRVIHGTSKHAGKRKRHVMIGIFTTGVAGPQADPEHSVDKPPRLAYSVTFNGLLFGPKLLPRFL